MHPLEEEGAYCIINMPLTACQLYRVHLFCMVGLEPELLIQDIEIPILLDKKTKTTSLKGQVIWLNDDIILDANLVMHRFKFF